MEILQRAKQLTPAFLLCGSMLLSTGCVARAQYDEALLRAKQFEQRYYSAQEASDALATENQSLSRQLSASDAEIRAASAAFEEEADARIGELDKIMSELGTNSGDATKFRVEGGYVYRVKDAILFALGSSEISSEGKVILGRISEDIRQGENGRIYVRGHTDNIPIKKPSTKQRYPMGNIQLSADRALNVAHALWSGGNVPEERIAVVGFGSNAPLVENSTVANRSKNRRVDIFVATDEVPGVVPQ